jgi:hypothetical protein
MKLEYDNSSFITHMTLFTLDELAVDRLDSQDFHRGNALQKGAPENSIWVGEWPTIHKETVEIMPKLIRIRLKASQELTIGRHPHYSL